jgi:mRNA-degrading endonuclease YafQ of YafQ-DinJ toxin-antitoxin module
VRTDFTKNFRKQYQKLPKKIQTQFTQRLKLFIADQNNSLLTVHTLTGDYRGCSSFNVTGDIRAVFKIQVSEVALFIAIGSHSELYS